MFKKIINYLKGWWKRNIVDDCPPELADDEFSEKYRK